MIKDKYKNKFRNFKSGFSFLEILIYVSILSIIVVIVSNTFVSLSRGRGQSGARSEVNNAMRFSTELLRQDIKNASVITVPATGSTSSTLTLTRGGVIIVYDVSGGALRRQEGTNTPINLTNSNVLVSAPLFTRIENTNTLFSDTDVSLRINMTFSYNSNNPDWIYSTSLQTAVGLY